MSNFEASKSDPPEHAANTSAKIMAQPRFSLGDRATAGTIIGAHTLTHIYARSFYVMVPLIYQQLGMVPIQAGLLDAARWLSSGFGGMFAGPVVDMYRHRRGLFLGLSMTMMGVGYFLVSLAPTYVLILLALAFAHMGIAIWHPPGIGLLSQLYPRRRGLLIALHRSSGNVGETVGPPLIGLLLVAMTWQQTLQAGLPLSILLSIALWVLLWNAGGRRVPTASLKSNFRNLITSLRKAMQGSGLITLMAITAVRGMGDRALFLFIPLYLAQNLKMDTVGIGFHMGLLTLLGIASGPIVGAISDRIGRKPMIVMVMLISSVFPPLMVMAGAGINLTIIIALFGVFLYTVNSLAQAAAMDIAGDMKLEGTFIGLLWGNNAFFGALSPILAGALAGVFGFQVVFYYAAIIYLAGGLLALRLRLRNTHQP